MRKMKSKVLVGFLSLLIATLVVWEGRAQSQEAYPTRPVEIIVPVAAGGSTDLVNRIFAPALSKKWGVPVNVVNKPGGNYIPGILSVYNAKPDGYTVLADINSINSMLGVAVKDLPFKIMDRTFVCVGVALPLIVVVPANSPFKTLKELAAEAKRDPGNFMYAIIGMGTDSIGFALRQFFKEIDFDPQKGKAISTSGGSQVVIMVAGGNAMMGFSSLPAAVASLKAGTLRGLALTSKNRDPDWPDIPTTAEAGYPNVNIMQWNGISGPPNLPAFIVVKWEKAMEEILRDPEVIAKLKNIGMIPAYLNSKATREYVIKETDEVSKLWGSMR